MSDAPQKPELPSPLHFLGEVLFGAMMGLLPAFLIFLTFNAGFTNAIGIMAIILVFGGLYHFAGWVIVMAPLHILRWSWRKLTGQPSPAPIPPAPPAAPRHWVERAGFWSGFALINLLMLRAGLNISEGLS
ncbi:hypothetical protein FQV27_07640 [Paracoccus aurantiacus]|uniref:Uncharacterized protein n=1 Tax=Paracoccus aurantiacus TaxID=2599412 RepID=A0A5C6S6C0_9RHOB|nr:hypothetical protein [Paracoccus aurantiacus]TXB69965.1 hypothetical protein FQV27_07640 [Paracoccus aurantiacus]